MASLCEGGNEPPDSLKAKPSKAMLYNLVKTFRTTRSVLVKKRTYVKRVLTEEMLDEIGHQLERSLASSSRRVAQQVGVSQSSVIMTKHKFHLSGYVDTQNSRYCGSENPHRFHEQPLHDIKIEVWYTMSGRRLIGPISFEETVNAQRYTEVIFRPFFNELSEDEKLYSYVFQVYAINPHSLEELKISGTKFESFLRTNCSELLDMSLGDVQAVRYHKDVISNINCEFGLKLSPSGMHRSRNSWACFGLLHERRITQEQSPSKSEKLHCNHSSEGEVADL
ncbi:hypothetical protein ANN_23093 [Periplaneta americana]|uniref:Uncharacterized protein n=1 Tax=Periplaneta americana TaxID=6978 RepID=A0ABQ8SK81_PERAM|nr:hypothetical protein ANN_23093 [Periplaneta americana]